MYMKLVSIYGNKGQNAWYQEIGNGCFQFVNDKKYASFLTEDECANIEKYADWYCKQYNAENLIVDVEDTLIDRVICGLMYCNPNNGCWDCPYYAESMESCDTIAECRILDDARMLLEQYKGEKQNK